MCAGTPRYGRSLIQRRTVDAPRAVALESQREQDGPGRADLSLCVVIEKPFLPSEVRRVVAELAMESAAAPSD